MIVNFTDRAEKDLDKIFVEIDKDSESRAVRMIDRITRHAEKLGHVVRIGRIVPEYEDDTVREIQEKPYRIIYKIRVNDNRIDILTVHHAKQILPSLVELGA